MTVDSPRNGWIVLLSFTLNVKNVCIVLVCTTVHMHHLTLQYSPEGAERPRISLDGAEVTGRVNML